MEEEKKITINNNNIIAKLSILKNALLDERKKSENFQNEIKKLKEENLSIQDKLNLLKEENIIKQEQIEKLKEEILKYKNQKAPKKLQNFFNKFFDENDEGKQDYETIEALQLLKKENEDLKEQITLIKNDKMFINGKLNESIKDFNELKEKYENKIKEIENRQNEKIMKFENDINEKDEKYKKEINEKNKLIYENVEKSNYYTQYIKSFDSQKSDYENKISKFKQEIENYKENLNKKEEEINFVQSEKKFLLEKLLEFDNNIQDLKFEIQQYKNIISEMTPISNDYIFSGHLIPNDINDKKRLIQIKFIKKNKFYFKIEKEKELFLTNKEVIDIIQDSKRKNYVKIILRINNEKKNFLCEFTEKEISSLINFFIDFKKKPNLIEGALIGMNVDYFY